MADVMKPVGNRLVTKTLVAGGCYQFEVASSARVFQIPLDEEFVLEMPCAVVRVKCNKTKMFTVFVVTESGRVIGEVRSKTYKEALDQLRVQIEEF